ncbi:MAG: hypothetical protein Q9180_004837 [Flavoplaca navasiana]
MQECARLSIITPILLRTWLRPQHIEPYYLEAVNSTMMRRFGSALGFDATDCIVQCFAHIAKSNTVILSLSMSQKDRETMDWDLKANRKAFQRLYECAAIAATTAFKNGEDPTSSQKTPAPALASRQDSIDFDDELTEYSVEEQEERLNNSQIEQLGEVFDIDDANKAALTYQKVQSRPNVHVALHFTDVAAEYATPNNCTTLTGEDKHRGYKLAVLKTNKHDVVKPLLQKESLQQCLRFLLAGSYLEKDSAITNQVRWIHGQCPSLMRDLLPFSEQADESEEAKVTTAGDEWHQEPLAIGCLQSSYIKRLGWPVKSAPMMEDEEFSLMLRKAYEVDYDEPYLTLPRARIQWCSKCSFLDPTRRMLFARVTLVEGFSEQKLDPVLNIPYKKLSTNVLVVGLPRIGAQKQYIMNVRRKLKDVGVALERGGQSLLLQCNYDIQFM